MSRVLSLFVCVVALLAVGAVNAQDILNIGKCDDTLFCRPETCSWQPVSTGQCLNASSNGQVASQILLCNPNVQTVGELFFFSDSFCTVAMDSQSFICGQCSNDGKMQKIDCINKNGFESLSVKKCADTQCQNNCQTAVSVPRGACIATQGASGQTVYLKYDGVQVANTVDQLIYEGSASCQGKISKINVLPADHCIAPVGQPKGTFLNCKYAQNNVTAPQNMNAVRHNVGDSPCPSKDEHKLECALAIADCVAECVVGDPKNQKLVDGKLQFDPVACVECIIEKVGDGKVKECCQTLSHYCHFGCDVCNHV